MREWPHLLLAGKSETLASSERWQFRITKESPEAAPRGSCCRHHLAKPGGAAAWLPGRLPGRGRGVGHARVTGTAGHDQIRQRMLAEPPRDGGNRRFAGWARGLLLERAGDDGAGDGHDCVPPGRIDGDHADDGAGGVL